MVHSCVTKVHRQHNSVVTTVPVEVRVRLGLNAGDYIVWEVDDVSNFVQISKVVSGGRKDIGSKRITNRPDSGR